MKTFLLWVCILILPFTAFAEDVAITLEKAPVNSSDIASIKRGAKFFSSICMACHTMVYMRYNKIAKEAGVTYERMPLNIKKWPFDVKPPDLSLEADYRGVDWIYTYLHSFYQDPTQPTGVNNLLVQNSKMAGIIVPFQGQQIKATDLDASKEIYAHDVHYYDLLVLQKQGSMTPEQFDATVTDVVNFLAYAADPYKQEQNNLGYWVIGFLIIMVLLTILLKKAYWKGIGKHKNE